MAGCLELKQLERFAIGELSEAEIQAAEAHLESCRRCAEALARLPVGNELIERIRDLERSRQENAPALARLTELEERVSSTLFGERKT